MLHTERKNQPQADPPVANNPRLLKEFLLLVCFLSTPFFQNALALRSLAKGGKTSCITGTTLTMFLSAF